MEFDTVQKEVRKFLRASDVLLGLMRNVNGGQCTAHELHLIRGYLASLKAQILDIETAERVQVSANLTKSSSQP